MRLVDALSPVRPAQPVTWGCGDALERLSQAMDADQRPIHARRRPPEQRLVPQILANAARGALWQGSS